MASVLTEATAPPAKSAGVTASEYADMPEGPNPTELIEGEVVDLNLPTRRHGQVAGRAFRYLDRFCEETDFGHAVINDAGFLVGEDPDTVRGPDVQVISYAKIPKGPLPDEYDDVPPDVAVEVRSRTDRWRGLMSKATQFLDAGAGCVLVLDPDSASARVFYPDAPNEVFTSGQTLTLGDALPGFEVAVADLFA